MIEDLRWDSDFFQLKVGKIELEKFNDIIDQLPVKNPYDLLYIFQSENFSIALPVSHLIF